jgi:multidrug efflux pump subunit AcrA (membrane-fusion protein)
MSKRMLLCLGWMLALALLGATGCEDWNWFDNDGDDEAALDTAEDPTPQPSAEEVQIAQLEAQVADLMEENRALESRVFTQSNDLLRMEADLGALRASEAEQDRMIAAQQAAVDERNALQAQVADLEQELLIQQAERDLLLSENQALQTELNALRVRYDSLAHEMGIDPVDEVAPEPAEEDDVPADDDQPLVIEEDIITIDE